MVGRSILFMFLNSLNESIKYYESMSINLIDSFSEFKNMKSIDLPTMIRVLEDVFRTLIRKKYSSDENFDIIVNADEGDLEIWRKREIVPDGEVEDDRFQITIADALMIEDDYEVGEDVSEQIDFDKEFGRRQILSIRQHLLIKINELHRDELIKRYSDRIGESWRSNYKNLPNGT
jgi:N utilization substance protein A